MRDFGRYRPDLFAFLPKAKIKVPHRPAGAGNARPRCIYIIQIWTYIKITDTQMGIRYFWRYRPDLNWGMRVLQTLALPLGHGTIYENRNAKRSYPI